MNSPERARGLIAAIASGVLLAAAYPRPGMFLLAFAALAPFLISLKDCPPARALLRGYACGAVFFALLLYWVAGVMVDYGGLSWAVAIPVFALLIGYLSTYVAVFALLVAATWRRLGAQAALSAAPFAWVGLELARARLLSGFPWGLLGYSQVRNLPLLQTAALGGVYLVSFVVLCVNAAVAILILRARPPGPAAPRGFPPAAAAMLLIAVAAHAGGAALLGRPPGGASGAPVPVAAIQANVPQDRKWSPAASIAILADLERLTREAAAAGARLIVWPESSSPFSIGVPLPGGAEGTGAAVQPHRPYRDRLRALAAETGATLLVGTVDYRILDGRLRATNSAVLVTPDGGPGPIYDKVHLVPFGEYVPLQRLLFFVDRMAQGTIADFAPGRSFDALPTAWGNAAVFICYEAIFPELVRRLAADQPAFLLNLTNDAWFGHTSAPAQHLAMAVVRAVETRRDLLRAANTGYSAVVDPRGRIVARTAMDERAILPGALTPRSGSTPYARTGDLFAGACAILAIAQAAALRAAFLRRSH